MMTSGQDAGPQPEHVVPPAPADAGVPPGAYAPPAVPLAPPLSPPAGSPPPPPWQVAPAQPPYVQPGAVPPHAGVPPQQPYGAAGYPVSASTPHPRSSSRNAGLIIGIVSGVVLLAIVGLGVAVALIVGARPGPSAPVATPSSVAEPPREEPSDPPSDDPPAAPAPDADAEGIGGRLDAKIEEYRQLRDSGALWESIPDTEHNRVAVVAYLYFLTDMKGATYFGVDEQTAAEYDERMAMLEQRLLAQEPLGDDIEITFEDGKVFRYDGTTGDGGYFEE